MNSSQTVRVFRSIDGIGKEEVDSIADDGFFTYGWFKTLEEQKTFNITPLYIVAYASGKIVAVAPCFVDLSDDYFTYGAHFFPFMRNILKMGNRFRLWQNHLLLCYSPLSFKSEVLLHKECDQKLILSLLSKNMDDICKKERLLFSSFLFVSENDRPLVTNLQNFNYLKYPWWKDSLVLDVKWSNFDDYLASLKHKIRLTIRREIKKFNENGMKIEEISQFGDLSDTLANLYSNLFSKYNKNAKSPYDASFFKNLSIHAIDKVIVLTAMKNKEIMGFCLLLRQGDVLDCYMCGFNYDVQTNTDFVYFNLVYYAPIKLAIEKGVKKINFRIAAEKVKLRRGCRQERIYSFIKCHNRPLAALLNIYAGEKFTRYA